MKIFKTHDTATMIGEVIGTLLAFGAYCLMAYGLYFGMFH